MKAKDYLLKTIKELGKCEVAIENIVIKKNRFNNFIFLLIRKFTSQKFRININLYNKIFNKINYYSKKFSLDYIFYIIENDPIIPIGLFNKEDKNQILTFLKFYFLLAFKDFLSIEDFGNIWFQFEEVRKKVGKNLNFNPIKNIYEIYGFKSIVYPDTGVFPDFLNLKKIFKKSNYKNIFDLGAFIGDTAYPLFKIFDPEKVYAFEPDPDNFEILKENIQLNHLEEIVIPIEQGVGKKDGYFYIQKAGAGSEIKKQKDENSVKVKVTTIDNFVKKNKIKKVDFIKMDIEGAEFDALKGAVKTLKRDKPDLLIAIYHKGEHFFEIPGWLKKIVPDYNLRFIAMNGASPIIERYVAASVERI